MTARFAAARDWPCRLGFLKNNSNRSSHRLIAAAAAASPQAATPFRSFHATTTTDAAEPARPPLSPWLDTSTSTSTSTSTTTSTTRTSSYKFKFFQDNAWKLGKAADDLYHPVRNPATNQLVGQVPESTTTVLETSVKLAKTAFEDWKDVPVMQRQRVMLELQRLIRDNMDDLSYWITLENGKTLADAKGDVIRGLEQVEAACWVAPQLLGR